MLTYDIKHQTAHALNCSLISLTHTALVSSIKASGLTELSPTKKLKAGEDPLPSLWPGCVSPPHLPPHIDI